MLANMKVGYKIYTLAGILLALMLVSSMITIGKLGTMASEIKEIAEKDISPLINPEMC